MQRWFDGSVRWAAPLLLAALAACGTSADGADGTDGAGVDAATATRPHCPQTLEQICRDAGSSGFLHSACCTTGPDCVGQRPATLAPFCGGAGGTDGGVTDYGTCRGGLDVVVAYSGVDGTADFYYGADGKLVAIGHGVGTTESCAAGPADFSSPIGSGCGGIGRPQCCYLEQDASAELGCPVSTGAPDAGVD